MYRLKELDLRLPASQRVVKAAEAQALIEADGILEAAKKKAADIVKTARRHHKEEKKRGYEEGLALASSEAIDRLLEETASLEDGLANVNQSLCEVVIACLRNILGEIGDRKLVRTYIANAIRQMRRQKRIRLSVSPDHFADISEHMSSITSKFVEIEMIDVVENPKLTGTHFVMESEIGRITGSIEQSIDDLKESLAVAIGKYAVRLKELNVVERGKKSEGLKPEEIVESELLPEPAE